MRCPICGSSETKKVKVIDVDWRPGSQRCVPCGHVGDWGDFCVPPLPKIVAPVLLVSTGSLLMT